MQKINIFDKIPITLLDSNEFINNLFGWVKGSKKKKIYYLNASNVAKSLKDKKYLSVLRRSDLNYTDGWGPLLAAKIMYGTEGERVNAADFIAKVFKRLGKGKAKIYLLGDSDYVVKKAAANISKKFKSINVCGFHDGFFGKKDNEKIISEINQLKPDLVLIGLGSPKQEFWVDDNYRKLPSSVYWCVGGLFNYIARVRKRAPSWMISLGGEWLYRFFQEPRRLFKRYTVENLQFLLYLGRYLVKEKIFN